MSRDLILSNNIGTNPVDLVDGMSIQFDYPGTNGIVIKRTNRISLADYDTTKTTDEEKRVKYNNLIILKGASNADSISFSMTGKNKAADIYSWVKDKLENQTYDEELLTMIKEIKSKAELSKANYLKTDVNSFHISREIEDFKNSAHNINNSIQALVHAVGEVSHATNEGALGISEIAEKTMTSNDNSKDVLDQMNRMKQSMDVLVDDLAKFKI